VSLARFTPQRPFTDGNGVIPAPRLRFLWPFPARFLASRDLPANRPCRQRETVSFPVWFPFVSRFHAGGVSKETGITLAL
jgi:hypothetical protein